jgi:hypothetical protein
VTIAQKIRKWSQALPAWQLDAIASLYSRKDFFMGTKDCLMKPNAPQRGN